MNIATSMVPKAATNGRLTVTTNFSNAATQTVDVAGCALVYRDYGEATDIPIVFLNHLTGTLDDWDPAFIDGFAAHRRVVVFDNRGVGGSAGTTPDNIEDMARDAISFLDELGLTTVDLVGFSMGGFVAQLIAHDRPDLVRRLVLAGTGPAGGEGIRQVGAVVQRAIEQAIPSGRHPKHILFFSQTPESQRSANEFLARLSVRQLNRDPAASKDTVDAHILAITAWGTDPGQGRPLSTISQPVLVANGDNDIMVPTANSITLFRSLPNAELSIFPDAGHGGIFQYHSVFVAQALRFLGRSS